MSDNECWCMEDDTDHVYSPPPPPWREYQIDISGLEEAYAREALMQGLNQKLDDIFFMDEGKAETRATDPATGGQKGKKLEEFALVPVWPREEEARVYGYGAQKYEPNNWRRGYSWSWSLSALHRHIARFEQGESVDPESGLHHLAHAKFHLNTLMEFERLGLGTDDRYVG